jgi:hypothetical protein
MGYSPQLQLRGAREHAFGKSMIEFTPGDQAPAEIAQPDGLAVIP